MCSLVVSASASAYQPTVVEGNQWNVVNRNADKQPGSVTYTTAGEKTEGDSTIGGVVYKKLFCSSDSELAEWKFEALVREENRKVFVMTDGKEHLLYDFNMKANDHVSVTSISTIKAGGEAHDYVVTAIDSAADNNGTHIAKFTLTDGDGHSTIIYEGYGTQSGWMRHDEDNITGSGINSLRCVYNPERQLAFRLDLPWEDVTLTDDECYVRTTSTAPVNNVQALSGSIVYDNASQTIQLNADNATSLTVYGMQGQAVFQTSITGNSVSFAAPAGIYIVVVQKAGNSYSKKITVQ